MNEDLEFTSGQSGAESMLSAIQDRERRYTEEELYKDLDWIEASGKLYEMNEGKKFDGDYKELAKYGIDQMSQFNYNMTMGMIPDVMAVEGADHETQIAFAYLMDTYDKKDVTLAGVGRAFTEAVFDPLNWVGALSIGSGFAMKKGAQELAKEGLKNRLHNSIRSYLTSGVAVGATEGALYTAGDEVAKESIYQDAGLMEGYSGTNIATSALSGAVAGYGIAKGAGYIGKQVAKGIDYIVKQGEEAMAQVAGGGTPPQAKDLLIQHNLSERNIQHAEKMGGLAVPSLAITKKESPLDSFGDITMIGNKELATPSKEHKVFGADIYSPRYPNVEYKFSGNNGNKVQRELEDIGESIGYDYVDMSSVGDSIQLKAKFLQDNNIPFDKAEHYYDTRSNIQKAVNEHQQEFDNYAQSYLQKHGATEVFRNGYTYSGKAKYKEHTLANVVDKLKKDLRGGEGFNYGMGSLRAEFTPQFKNLNQITKAKDKLVSKEDFTRVKEEVSNEFSSIQSDLGNIRTETLMSIISESKTRDLDTLLKEYGVEATDDIKSRINDFKSALVKMPTEYFESKMLRGMSIGEFSHAVIPSNASKKTIDILNKNGVAYTMYDVNAKADRINKIKEVAEKNGYLFAVPALMMLDSDNHKKETK